MDPMVIGQVGVAHFGAYRRRQLRDAGCFRLVAICDRDADLLAAAAREENATSYADFAAMLAHPGLEGVVISTGADSHAALAVAALRRGLHVFVEKPLCCSREEVDELRDARRETRRVVGVGHNHCGSDPLLLLAKQYIDEGRLGTLCAVEANTSHSGGLEIRPGDWRGLADRNPGGMLFQSGSPLPAPTPQRGGTARTRRSPGARPVAFICQCVVVAPCRPGRTAALSGTGGRRGGGAGRFRGQRIRPRGTAGGSRKDKPMIRLRLQAPLGVAWTEQYVRRRVPGLAPGAAVACASMARRILSSTPASPTPTPPKSCSRWPSTPKRTSPSTSSPIPTPSTTSPPASSRCPPRPTKTPRSSAPTDPSRDGARGQWPRASACPTTPRRSRSAFGRPTGARSSPTIGWSTVIPANVFTTSASGDIERQLDAYAGRSGAWEESINYALFTFGYMVVTFRAVKARWGLDLARDERVRRFAGWLCRFLGPVDLRFGVHTWPGLGNARLPQTGGEYLLCYAALLEPGDPLRDDCLAVWQRVAPAASPDETLLCLMAVSAPRADRPLPLPGTDSEWMDEVGVALRHRRCASDESSLVQKAGFAKDHYENDESAFDWYAKGIPFCLDYGTYSGDIAIGAAHNKVEPVTQKLSWGRVRRFDEIDTARGPSPYFYLGDPNPVGPKAWRVRLLLWVKPDYLVLFDRIVGAVEHRYHLHFTGTGLRRDGPVIHGTGRFSLDLLAYVQHPIDFHFETGVMTPRLPDPEAARTFSQNWFRLRSPEDGCYRTIVFARERGRDVRFASLGRTGIRVSTPEYVDDVFLNDGFVEEAGADFAFRGLCGWSRRTPDGRRESALPDGEFIG